VYIKEIKKNTENGRKQWIFQQHQTWLMLTIRFDQILMTAQHYLLSPDLAHVNMVVGVYWSLRAELSSEHFNSTVCNHFINVHIGLGARASLPYYQRKVIVKLPRSHL